MADSKIVKKPSPVGSLPLRVLFASLWILVIPLILHSFFLYRQEYLQRVQDAKQLLQVLGAERAARIGQAIELEGEKGRLSQLASLVQPPINAPYPLSLFLINQSGEVLLSSGKKGPNSLTVSVPIPTLDQGEPLYLLLAVPKGAIAALQRTSYYQRFASLLIFIALVGGSAVLLLTRRIARPLGALCSAMQRVSEGALHVRYTPDRMGFEINDLGQQFNETLDALLHNQLEVQRERIGREKLAQELRIGHEIQMGLLPTDLPPLSGLEVAPGYLPAKEVSGDFYDLFPLENGKILIAIADTAGKGISACLFALGLRSMLRSFAQSCETLSQIVLKTNSLFWLDAHQTSMFVTLWVALYDPKEKLLTYCSQGHPPAYLQRGESLQELSTLGIALGAQQLDVIQTAAIRLEPHDLLLLYTDGIVEAHNLQNEFFGKTRLTTFLQEKREAPLTKRVEELFEEVRLFSQGAPQHDDMTLVLLRI